MAVQPTMGMTPEQRFWHYTETADGCWEWQGNRLLHGYGQISVKGHKNTAHRFSYVLHFGPIPEGMCVCHHCDNRGCVNPAHLFLGSQGDNLRDASEKGRLNFARGPKGEAHHMTTVTEDDVREIRRRYAAGEKQGQIGEAFGIGRSTVHFIVTRKTWAHVA